MESTATAPATCEIARLPDDLLSASLARTGPREACRAALVSPAFRAAADADAVWSSLLPRDLPPLADGELDPQPTKKQLFMRLSDSARPVLLADGLTSMWLDRATAAKCYMLSARELCIIWGGTPQYWRWIPLTDSRFSEGAELLDVCWLEIRGKIHCKMLSQNTTYAAYMVFKISDESYGLDYPPQEAEVNIGATKSTRQVCLQGSENEGEDGEEVPQNYQLFRPVGLFRPRVGRRNRRTPPGVHVHRPRTRADGWMEVELGEFNNEGGEDGEVSISLMEIKGGHWKKGLIVQGIEIRASLARTGPRDACRAAAVSPAFRAAADADAVWSSLLPRDLPPLADGELPADPQPTKKQLFMRLSDSARPVLLADGITSMWLDRATAAKCYMLSARKLCIIWSDTPRYWRWIPLTDSRFSEGAELLAVCWLEIRGKIHCNMLSQNTTYAAYMVFKMSDKSYGLDNPLQEAEVSIGATKSTRQVCLGYDNEVEDGEEVPQNYRSFRPVGLFRPRIGRRNRHVPPRAHVQHPQTRADGWMEMEIGEFKNEEGEDGEVSISLMETRGGNWKKGLILQGIEIRVKK